MILGRFHAWKRAHAKKQPSFPVSLEGVGAFTFSERSENPPARNLFKFLEPLKGLNFSMKMPHKKDKQAQPRNEEIPVDDCGWDAFVSISSPTERLLEKP